MIENKGKHVPLIATVLNPAEFPIGSPQSRAAARMFAANRQDNRQRIQFVTNAILPPLAGYAGPEDETTPWFGPWQECTDGALFRFVFKPTHFDKSPSAAPPVCRGCGTPFRRADSGLSAGMGMFEAACMKNHEPN
jgi:hypothetical protein